MWGDLELDLAGTDVGEELWRDGHEVSSLAEVQRLLDHVGVEAFLLVLKLLQLKCTCEEGVENVSKFSIFLEWSA